MSIQMTLVVEERHELSKHIEVICRTAEPHRFDAFVSLRSTLHPEVADLHPGDELRVTLEHIPGVFDVERIIEEAELAGLPPASLV